MLGAVNFCEKWCNKSNDTRTIIQAYSITFAEQRVVRRPTKFRGPTTIYPSRRATSYILQHERLHNHVAMFTIGTKYHILYRTAVTHEYQPFKRRSGPMKQVRVLRACEA